jgi:hypothetical protein
MNWKNWITFPRFLLLVVFIAQWHILAVRFDGESWKDAIPKGGDAHGYYMYLPNTFIENEYPYSPWKASQPDSGYVTVNRYFIGTSVAQLPFFLVSDLLVQQFRFEERTGYSAWYIAAICISGLFYLLIGLISLHKLLLRFGFSEIVSVLALITLCFATNLYYYAFQEPGMSHLYSFGCIAWFLLILHQQVEVFKAKRLILLVFLLSLIVFIRPVNALFLLAVIPFAGSLESLNRIIGKLLEHWKVLLVSLVIPVAFILIQSLYYFAQTHQWWIYSYGNEGFDFLNPQWVNLLFSYRKGWLVYTPVFILLIPAIYCFYKQFGRFSTISFTLIFILFIYITASWWCWWYGGSYGSRPFVDLLPLCAIAIASIYRLVLKATWKKYLVGSFVGLCIFLNLFQVWQYIHSILPFDEMDSIKYKKIFLQNGNDFIYLFEKDEVWIRENFPHPEPVWTSPQLLNKQAGASQKVFLGKDSLIELIDISVPPEIFTQGEIRMMRIDFQVRMSELHKKAALISELGSCDYPVFWNKKLLIAKVEQPNRWETTSFLFPIHEFPGLWPEINLSLFQPKNATVEIRNLKIQFLRNKSS